MKALALPIKPPYPVMDAELVAELPRGEGWQYEPKWDGFRCLSFRSGGTIELQSKSGKPLARYFPDIVEMLESLAAQRFVIDSELLIPVDGGTSFEEPPAPAPSRGQPRPQARGRAPGRHGRLRSAGGREGPIARRRAAEGTP